MSASAMQGGHKKLNLTNKQLLGLFICVCMHCAQLLLLHTILHRTDLIIFTLTLQTIVIALMMFM